MGNISIDNAKVVPRISPITRVDQGATSIVTMVFKPTFTSLGGYHLVFYLDQRSHH